MLVQKIERLFDEAMNGLSDGGGTYASDGTGHYDGRYAAAQPYGMSMMSMPGGGGGGGMGMKPPGQSHVPGGHVGRPHGYGQLGRMDDGQDGSQDQQVGRRAAGPAVGGERVCARAHVC